MNCLLQWLAKYEALAVWIEGLALVGIFGFDIWVAHRDHKETLQQIDLAQKQILASHNAERAWVMTELSWAENSYLHIAETSSTESGDAVSLSLKLTCRNEGRSPAWVYAIYAHCRQMDSIKELPELTTADMQRQGITEPIGPGKTVGRNFILSCPGQLASKEFISVYVIVEYRDVFENTRMTSLGYVVAPGGNLYRQEGLPGRNKNT
jgi:hypothetical protein